MLVRQRNKVVPAIVLASVLAVTAFFRIGTVHALDIRKPVWAGSFYPESDIRLKQAIDSLTGQAKNTRVELPRGKTLKALIMPHAGYVYSGLTAAHAALVLHEGQFKKVVLVGPDHRVGFGNGAISAVDAYLTPIGLVGLHEDAVRLRSLSDMFRPVPASDNSEHSLEVILPFLQHYLKEFKLVPIVLGPVDIGRITGALDPVLDLDTLLVASTDLSHFLPHREAVDRDKETIAMILRLETDLIAQSDNRACGKVPVAMVLNLARRHNWQPFLLHYSNSGDTAGDRNKVVGYATIAFYGDSSMQNNKGPGRDFTEKQGQELVRLARRTIKERFGQTGEKIVLTDASYKDRRGVFVTLKIHGDLRGCIGSLTATESVLDGVKRNATNAAFHDPRFSPLTEKELDNVDIEVSILTEPQPLEYKDADDLLAKLRVKVDGVILRKGPASATFLPQVWDQLPRPEDFLGYLCRKAGLPTTAWKETKLEVLTYQVQYFDEEK